MLDIILSQAVSGLVLGGLYVLIAIGLSIIFGLLGIVNFAHGTFFTLGAYLALTLFHTFGWPAVVPLRQRHGATWRWPGQIPWLLAAASCQPLPPSWCAKMSI